MERVAFDEVEPTTVGTSATRQELAGPLNLRNLAFNRYRVPPNEALPGGLHAHMDQEEAFVVTSGTLTFETFEGIVTVSRAEAIRFAPGEFQSGQNRGDEPVVVLAIGAPSGSSDVRIPVDCPSCGHEDLRMEFEPDGMTFVCPACQAAHVPAPCPACGREDLRVKLQEDHETEVRCHDCGATFERPPLRD